MESEERAIEIAARLSAVPGPDGVATQQPIQVRQVMDQGASDDRLQAAIAALHDRAQTADQTDWPQIPALYGLLEKITGNPVVTLNRAVAAAMADGPSAGLALLEVDERLAGHYGSTRSGQTCSKWPVTGRARWRTIAPRQAERRTSPSGAT